MTLNRQKVMDEICDEIINGKSLRAICTNSEMPSVSTVMRWLSEDSDIQEQYTRAREAQADTIFDECLAIADKFDGSEILEPEHIQRAKLRIDTRKWMAGKMRPKKYGDKHIIGGDAGLDPIETKEVGSPALKLAAYLDGIAKRSGTDSGTPD